MREGQGSNPEEFFYFFKGNETLGPKIAIISVTINKMLPVLHLKFPATNYCKNDNYGAAESIEIIVSKSLEDFFFTL